MPQSDRTLLRPYAFYLGGDQPQVNWRERIHLILDPCIGLMLVITIVAVALIAVFRRIGCCRHTFPRSCTIQSCRS